MAFDQMLAEPRRGRERYTILARSETGSWPESQGNGANSLPYTLRNMTVRVTSGGRERGSDTPGLPSGAEVRSAQCKPRILDHSRTA